MCQAKIRVLTALMGMCVPGLLAAADPVPTPADISIIPKPASLRQTAGSFTVDAATAIGITPVSAEMKRIGSYLADLVAPAMGFKLAVGPVPSGEGNSIILKLDDARKDLGEEGYALTSKPRGWSSPRGSQPAYSMASRRCGNCCRRQSRVGKR